MLDERCLVLLNIFNGECKNYGYKVFEIGELVSTFPARFSMDSDGIRECVKVLSDREYISVKYEDESEICLSLSVKGRLIFERRIDEEIEKSADRRRYFVYSFFGALAGGTAAGILAALLALFGGS